MCGPGVSIAGSKVVFATPSIVIVVPIPPVAKAGETTVVKSSAGSPVQTLDGAVIVGVGSKLIVSTVVSETIEEEQAPNPVRVLVSVTDPELISKVLGV